MIFVRIGIGGAHSGVSFHYHGPGFSEVLIGSKLWFLYPPDTLIPHHHPNMTMCTWYKEIFLPKLLTNPSLYPNIYYCIIHPGDVLYFPNKWLHATYNIEAYNFFVSLFLDIQLMKEGGSESGSKDGDEL